MCINNCIVHSRLRCLHRTTRHLRHFVNSVSIAQDGGVEIGAGINVASTLDGCSHRAKLKHHTTIMQHRVPSTLGYRNNREDFGQDQASQDSATFCSATLRTNDGLAVTLTSNLV